MKKGISLVSLAVVVIIMIILGGILVIGGMNSSKEANVSMFAIEILNIQTAVDEYYLKYNKYPSDSEYSLDMSTISSNSLTQFQQENVVDNILKLKTIKLSEIGINKTQFGNNKDEGELYVVSETTGRVYYVAGVEREGVVYYTLVEELYDLNGITIGNTAGFKDIKKYDVIFSVSKTDYTNTPITVAVKLPFDAIINSITATNSKSVSEQTIVNNYKVIEVNTTSEDKTGNYNITVDYTYKEITKQVEYAVTNFDNMAPVSTYTETENGDLKTIKLTTSDNLSGIKQVKYLEDIVSTKAYFESYGKKVLNNQFTIHKDDYFTIYLEDNAGNYILYNNLPENWQDNIVGIVDGVPIPKGFAASPYESENEENEGLVIYELTPEEIAAGKVALPDSESHQVSLTTRNQYVWVPVDKTTIDTTFVRQNFGMANTTINTNVALGTNFWEVTPTTEETTNNLKYMVKTTTLAEVQAMYASVKEYGGFFIARYEAGINTQRTAKEDDGGASLPRTTVNVHSKMGKIPYTYIPWTWNNVMNEETNGVVEVARGLYPNSVSNTTGVVSTLIYGVQWDRTLQWFIDTGKMTSNQLNSTEGSTLFGNYTNHKIEEGDLNANAKYWDYSSNSSGAYVDVTYTEGRSTVIKETTTSWALSTGALKKANVNNIYDMAGNMSEWTMEGLSNNHRSIRGGSFVSNGIGIPVSGRTINGAGGSGNSLSFRSALYIKK